MNEINALMHLDTIIYHLVQITTHLKNLPLTPEFKDSKASLNIIEILLKGHRYQLKMLDMLTSRARAHNSLKES